jgi:DtxR family transcriptional regulator, Mn-dependent transcriptional regulator
MYTQAIEDYLKTIYELGERGDAVSTSSIAQVLDLSAASVTGMLKKLAGMHLITHEPYHGVHLTDSGRKVALEVIRHHRLIELYLHEALGVPWDEVHAEAERMEHVLSENLEARIDAALGFPTKDPHGAPIPSADLRIEVRQHTPLAELRIGDRAIVAEVSDHDPALLRYVGELGLYPGTEVTVAALAPFEGPITVDMAGEELVVGQKAARYIFMAAIEKA